MGAMPNGDSSAQALSYAVDALRKATEEMKALDQMLRGDGVEHDGLFARMRNAEAKIAKLQARDNTDGVRWKAVGQIAVAAAAAVSLALQILT